MNILLTGASGFLGHHISLRAQCQGFSLTAISRQSMPDHVACQPRQVTWTCCDLLELGPENLIGHDVILHFAAATIGRPAPTWAELQRANIAGTVHLCNLAAELGIPIIIAGSSKEYGGSSDAYAHVPVSAQLQPVSPYAATKAAASILAASIGREKRNQTVYLRIFNAYGDRQSNLSLWPSMRMAALSGDDFSLSSGLQIRDFIPVEHVVAKVLAIVANLNRIEDVVHAYNIGSGIPQTVREFCEYWWQRWGATGRLLIGHQPLRIDDVSRSVADISDHPDWLANA